MENLIKDIDGLFLKNHKILRKIFAYYSIAAVVLMLIALLPKIAVLSTSLLYFHIGFFLINLIDLISSVVGLILFLILGISIIKNNISYDLLYKYSFILLIIKILELFIGYKKISIVSLLVIILIFANVRIADAGKKGALEE